MRQIIKANIRKFKELLKTESDPTKKAMLAKLLKEEEAKETELNLASKKDKQNH